jgi:energy-coupling factor transporter ATP-binding protein EcfA2
MIPDIALNSALAIMGKTGSGKTTAAKTSVEIMLDESRRVCILDPTGVWWGLRLAADGKKDSGLNVVIVGGGHADVPLTPEAGTQLAGLVAAGTLPQVIIDLSDFSGGQIYKFATSFFEELFRRNRAPLHLVLDEADTFAPQNPRPEQARMQGAVDKIARQGRVKGFRPMIITQRPQKIDKSVLAQIGTLVAMRLTLPHDRKAVHEWVKGNAAEEDVQRVLNALPSMPTGTGFLWCPDQDILEQVEFARPRTFDSSRAPEIGDQVVEPMPLAKLDMEAIRAQLDIAAEPDPAKKGQVFRSPKQDLADEYRRGFGEGQLMQQEALADEYRRGLLDGAVAERDRIVQMIADTASVIDSGAIQCDPVARSKKPQVAKPVRPPTSGSSGLHPAGRKLLEALAQHAPARWTWSQLGILAGLKASGGHFNSGRKSLWDAGYIIEQDGLIGITDSGLVASEVVPDKKPRTPSELLDMWCAKLPSPAPDILQALPTNGHLISIEKLAANIGKKPTGGHWNSGMAILRNNRLIEISGRDVRLGELFQSAA